MMRVLIVGAAAASLLAVGPASAQAVRWDPALRATDGSVSTVQYRPYRHRGGRGFPVGAGIAAGVLAGALLGGAINAAGAPAYVEAPGGGPMADADEYCASQFRSYDPASGTYMGYDGVRHSCP